MQASVIYLLTLLGIVLGVALGGVMGGLTGGIGFFLIHRVYALSKRLATIDERLRNLEPLMQEPAPTPIETSTPSQAQPVLPAAATPAPAHQKRAAEPPLPPTEPPPAPPPTLEPSPDPIIALNATLQALLPALNSLRVAHPPPVREPTQTLSLPPTALHSDRYTEPHTHIKKAELAEATAAATAVDRVLLNDPRDQGLSALPVQPSPEAPASKHSSVEFPQHALHVNTPPQSSSSSTVVSTSAHIASDLEHLRDELTTLMSDISAECARHTSPAPSAPSNEALLNANNAKTLQELLVELHRLTAQVPPFQH